MTDRQVVINTKCTIQRHRQDNVFSARLRQLGLTAYGDTEEEAVDDCKKLLSRFVNAYQGNGKLEEVLNRSGVEWHWRDQHPTGGPAPRTPGN